MRSKILGIIGFAGFFILFGSFDARSQDTILNLQFVIAASIGLLMMFISAHFAGVMEYQQSKKVEKFTSNEIMEAEPYHR